jgi:hypothetical protein
MKPGRSCSSRSSARPEQGFSRWRTSPGSWSGRGEALAEGHIFVEAAWSLSPARTPLWMPSSRAAAPNRAYIDLAPDGGRGGQPGDEYDRRWGRRTGRAGQRTVKTTTRKIMCEPGNILV